MVSQEDLHEIKDKILEDMYSEADPPLDYKKAKENPEEFSEDELRPEEHYLPQDRQEEILQNYFEKHNLSKREKRKLRTTVILEYGPSNSKN